MSSPVNLSDLPVATSAANNDLMLLRKGLTDYQVAVQAVRQINISALDPIPAGFADSNDLFMIARSGSNYNIRFSQVGFSKGVRMWFFNNIVPVGWSVVPNTGDKLLACNDYITPYTPQGGPGITAGTWQQTPHTLTISEIPSHTHTASMNAPIAQVVTGRFAGAQQGVTTPKATTDATGGGLGHDHGNTWRPLANVGVICNKDT